MRILHLSDRLSDRGGAHRHLLGILEHLSLAHEVTLAVGAREPGVEAPCPVLEVEGLAARESQPVALDDLASALRPDVVHLHTVVNPAALAWAAGRPAVMTVQDHRYFCPGRGKWTLAGAACAMALSREACGACFEDGAYFDATWSLTQARLAAVRRLRLVTLSEYMRRELRAAGCDGPIEVIPPFVHALAPQAASAEPGCVLFVGRLARAKGVWDAVEAWRRSGLAWPLVFAGTGPERAALEQAGARVLGWLDRSRLSAVLARARVLVLPSRWQEPFGIAGLEALHCGVPVAAWDSGGVREWHTGDGLVPWGDLDGLAAALRRLAGTRAQPPAGFEREALMRRLLAVYESMRRPAAPAQQASP